MFWTPIVADRTMQRKDRPAVKVGWPESDVHAVLSHSWCASSKRRIHLNRRSIKLTASVYCNTASGPRSLGSYLARKMTAWNISKNGAIWSTVSYCFGKPFIVQLPTSADNVALPAFGRRTPPLCAVLLQRLCCSIMQPPLSMDISCLPGPQQQTRRSCVRRRIGQTDRQMDGHRTVT